MGPIELSNEQLRIVEKDRNTRAMMVDAGPGSGKTRVLGARIQWLVEQGIDPQQILALTYTNQAGEELRRRLATMGVDVRASTIHSHSLYLIRAHRRWLHDPVPPKVIDEGEQIERLRQLHLDLFGWGPDDYMIGGMLEQIALRKRDGLEIGARRYFRHFLLRQQEFEDLDRAYCELNADESCFDYEDLIASATQLLTLNPVSEPIWLFVDEFHDVSVDQYYLVKALAPPTRNDTHLFVIWDRRQSIYRFRGANTNLVEAHLIRDYTPEPLELSANYRSVSQIVAAANVVLPNGKSPTLLASRESGQKIVIMDCENENTEAAAIESLVSRRIKSGDSPGDIAILYAKHSRGDLIEQLLIERKLPVHRIHPGMISASGQVRALHGLLNYAESGMSTVAELRSISIELGPLLDEFDWLSLHIGESNLATPRSTEESISPGTRVRVERFNTLLSDARITVTNTGPVKAGMRVIDFLRRAGGYDSDTEFEIFRFAQRVNLLDAEPVDGRNHLAMGAEFAKEEIPARVFVAIDVEATKKYVDSAQIIEIAAVRFDHHLHRIGEPFWTLIRVPFLPKDVQDLTGITPNELADGREAIDALTQFREWISDDDVLVGHSVAEFDIPLLNRQLTELNLPALGNDVVDTLPFSRRLYQQPSYKLEHLAVAFAFPPRKPHRAMPDVEATIDLFARIVEDRRWRMAAVAVGETDGVALQREIWQPVADIWDRITSLAPADAALQELKNMFALNTNHSKRGEVDAIHLMTIFASKGLEWKTVFLAGIEDDLFPFGVNPTLSDRDEAQRLLYVGLTRAKDQLAISHAGARDHSVKRRSRYLDGLSKCADLVHHHVATDKQFASEAGSD